MEQYDDYEGYENLANAIIAQAAEDYLNVKKQLYIIRKENTSEKKYLMRELSRIRGFFRSDWFKELSDADGEVLLCKLDELYKKWKKELVQAS